MIEIDQLGRSKLNCLF